MRPFLDLQSSLRDFWENMSLITYFVFLITLVLAIDDPFKVCIIQIKSLIEKSGPKHQKIVQKGSSRSTRVSEGTYDTMGSSGSRRVPDGNKGP